MNTQTVIFFKSKYFLLSIQNIYKKIAFKNLFLLFFFDTKKMKLNIFMSHKIYSIPMRSPPVLKEHLYHSLLTHCQKDALERWFTPLTLKHTKTSEQNILLVFFPHAFFADWFTEHGQRLFEHHAKQLCGHDLHIQYTTQSKQTEKKNIFINPPIKQNDNKEKNFENFFSNNKHTPVLHAINNAINTVPDYGNPLLLEGPSGTGKTHLLHAAVQECLKQKKYIFQTNAEQFIQTIQQTSAFSLRSYTIYAAFFFDNVHLLSEQETVQEHLAMLIDFFYENTVPMFFAGSGNSNQWHLTQKLLSRLQGGLRITLPEPDLDIRLRFTKNAIKKRHLIINKQQALKMAQRSQNLYQLRGLLHTLSLHQQMTGTLSETEFTAILDQNREHNTLTPQTIIQLVATKYAVTTKDILSARRTPQLVTARQVAMYFCRELLGYSYPAIGEIFAGKDHSTVMHAVKKIKEKQTSDKVMHTILNEMSQMFLNNNIPKQ